MTQCPTVKNLRTCRAPQTVIGIVFYGSIYQWIMIAFSIDETSDLIKNKVLRSRDYLLLLFIHSHNFTVRMFPVSRYHPSAQFDLLRFGPWVESTSFTITEVAFKGMWYRFKHSKDDWWILSWIEIGDISVTATEVDNFRKQWSSKSLIRLYLIKPWTQIGSCGFRCWHRTSRSSGGSCGSTWRARRWSCSYTYIRWLGSFSCLTPSQTQYWDQETRMIK